MPFAEIRQQIKKAALKKQKVAMIHLQVLKHASELEGVSAKEICRLVEIPEVFATEIAKMRGLAKLMEQEHVRLV